MKDVFDAVIDEDFCGEFCTGCSALRLVRNWPDEPDYDECVICGFDITDEKCLKRKYFELVKDAAENLQDCMLEALKYEGGSRFEEWGD